MCCKREIALLKKRLPAVPDNVRHRMAAKHGNVQAQFNPGVCVLRATAFARNFGRRLYTPP